MALSEIKPTLPQYQYMTTKAPYPAFVAGYGSGKTEASVLRAITGLIANPGVHRGYYEPTWDLVRTIAVPRFEEVLSSLNIPYKLLKQPYNLINVQGYGTIFFRSMERPERIVGYQHGDADVDELDTLKRDDAFYAWRQIIARNRQKKPNDQPNTIGVTTTPEGFRFVYEKWKKEPPPGYEIIKASTYSNPHLPDGYIQSIKDIYPEHLLAAYLNGDFVNLQSGTVYASYDRDRCDSKETLMDGEPLFIGCDFNVTQQAATVYVKRQDEDKRTIWHAVDELTKMYDTPEMVRIIQSKYPTSRIHIYPDASGKARKTVNASLSDIALLEQAGFHVRAKSKNPAIKDRVLAMNGALDHGMIKINADRCPNVAECLEQQVYKNGEPDKTSGKDHQNDATTYPVVYEMPIVKPVSNVNISFAV